MLFCLILLLFFSVSNTLDESEIAEIDNKIKNDKYCKNYLNGFCCVEEIGVFSSKTPFYNRDAIIQQYSNAGSGKISAIFENFNIANLNEVTLPLQNKNIEILKVVGSPRLTTIVFNRQSTLSPLAFWLVNLDLSHNSLAFQQHDEIHAFSHMNNLQHLDLSHNNISTTDILMKALERLPNLKSLYLNDNRKLNFGRDGFPVALGQLEFLDLSYCHVFEQNDAIFNNLVNLKELYLVGNGLSTIPRSICNRPATLQIHLAVTHISENYKKFIHENCTVKATFEIPFATDKNFRIVGDNNYYQWNLNGWFWMFLFSMSVIFIALVLYLVLYVKFRFSKTSFPKPSAPLYEMCD